jgi:hypothetical protein
MRIIAFVNDAGTVKKILDHIGESTQPPRISPARGPPLWEAAAAAQQVESNPQRDASAQSAPEIEYEGLYKHTWRHPTSTVMPMT